MWLFVSKERAILDRDDQDLANQRKQALAKHQQVFICKRVSAFRLLYLKVKYNA